MSYRTVESKEFPVHSAVLIFYDAKDDKFLLEKRSPKNEVLGGEVIFPSEKGVGAISFSTALRGISEEMGSGVKVKNSISTGQFTSQIGKLGTGIVEGYIITEWEGVISNMEPEKGTFCWVDRDKVMKELTFNESKHLFWIALCGLGMIKASDFENAPQIPPYLSR